MLDITTNMLPSILEPPRLSMEMSLGEGTPPTLQTTQLSIRIQETMQVHTLKMISDQQWELLTINSVMSNGSRRPLLLGQTSNLLFNPAALFLVNLLT